MENPIHFYQKRLGLERAAFIPIVHEDAMVAIVYKIEHSGKEPLILKICNRPKDFFRESYFLNFFKDTLPVARIVQLVEPEDGVLGAILMECLPGELLQVSELTQALSYEIGLALARVHLNRTSGYGDPIDPENFQSDSSVYFTQKFEEGFAECSCILPSSVLERSYEYYYSHVHLLEAADGPCFVHRDFRPGNLIINDGKLRGIIDWASCRASFAQDDFCPLEHGEWLIDPSYKEAFLAGYASIRKVPEYEAMMPLLRLSRAFAILGFTARSATWDTVNARVFHKNLDFLKKFLDQ